MTLQTHRWRFLLHGQLVMLVGIISLGTAQGVGLRAVPVFENVVVSTEASSAGIGGNQFVYTYTLSNPTSNTGSIALFDVDVSQPFGPKNLGGKTIQILGGAGTRTFAEIYDVFKPDNGIFGPGVASYGQTAPLNWNGGLTGDAHARFFAIDVSSFLTPGTVTGGFVLVSDGPPMLRTARIETDWYLQVEEGEGGQGDIDALRTQAQIVSDGLINTATVLGPRNSRSPSRILTELRVEIATSQSIGWLNDATIAQQLIDQIDSAIAALQGSDGDLADSILNDMIDVIDSASAGTFTNEFEQLVVLNANYVIAITSPNPTPFVPELTITTNAETLNIGEEWIITINYVNTANNDEGIPNLSIVGGCEEGFACAHVPLPSGRPTINVMTDVNGQAQYSIVGVNDGIDRVELFRNFSEFVEPLDVYEVNWEADGDLVVPLFVPPTVITDPGATIFLTDVTRNIGNRAVGASTTRYYISETDPIDINTAEDVGERQIPPLDVDEDSASLELPFTVPSSFGPGPYYLAACADANNQERESDEANNCSFSLLDLTESEYDVIAIGDSVEELVEVSVSGGTVGEGDSGTSPIEFSVTISQPDPIVDIVISYETLDGSATVADGDYVPVSGSLTFPSGTAVLTQSVNVDVVGDASVELDEEFSLQISTRSSVAELVQSIASGVILDDDDGGNVAPIASDQSVVTDEDVGAPIVLSAQDDDGDPLSYAVLAEPVNGVLSGAIPSLVYTPNPGFVGADSFTFIVNDGTIDSNVATVAITVNAVNLAPVADDQTVSTLENVPVNIMLNALDNDGDNLSFVIQTVPSSGMLSGMAPNLIYTPNPNFSGVDSFTFVANDGAVDSNVAAVSITVIPVNVQPVADDQNVVTDENVSVPVTLTAQDGDGDNLTFVVETGPNNGALSGMTPDLIYTPNTDFVGSDSFVFVANDGVIDSNIATVSITVNLVNVAPVADAGADQTVATGEAVMLDGSNSSDADGNPLTYSWTLTSAPTGSTAVLNDPAAVNPSIDTDLPGTYVVELIVNDGTEDSASDTVVLAAESSTFVLIIDEESVKKDEPPNYFSESDVNGDIAELGLRTQLPVFSANVGQSLTLYTGEVGDEGWFALPTIPAAWAGAGPTTDGLRNYVGELQQNGEILVGNGLGLGNDPEELLDKIPGVTPLRATGLTSLIGLQICGVVQDSDLSVNIDYNSIDGSLKGKSLGRVAFRVLSVTPLSGQSSSSLPEVDVEILDADQICSGDLSLIQNAPIPTSSSEPFDTGQ